MMMRTDAMNIDPFKSHIRQVCGLSFDEDKEGILMGAIQERMTEAEYASSSDYLKKIMSDEAEFQALVNLLTINETYFFRETQHIDLLTQRLLPKILAERESKRPVRILCAGCSTGEEPYSLSIALLEAFGPTAPQLFELTAVDIDSQVLARAERAVYSGLSFRNMPAGMVDRWFAPCEAKRFRLKDEVRQMVRFQQMNLLEDFYPVDLIGQDVILFRNVSIYFDVDVRKSVQAKLAGLLSKGGALIVGLTETLANDFGLLTLTADKGLFYFLNAVPKPLVPPLGSAQRPPLRSRPKTVSPARLPRPDPPLARAQSGKSLAEAKKLPAASLDQALIHLREKRYDEALAEVERLTRQTPNDPRHHVLRAHVAFNRKDMAAARTAAERALKADEWNLDALLLLAQIARLAKQGPEAVRLLKQVVYAHPKCWPAHYWLAELFRHAGDSEKAGREYRIVVNQTAHTNTGHKGDVESGLLIFPLGVSPTEVAALCRHQLKALGWNDESER